MQKAAAEGPTRHAMVARVLVSNAGNGKGGQRLANDVFGEAVAGELSEAFESGAVGRVRLRGDRNGRGTGDGNQVEGVDDVAVGQHALVRDGEALDATGADDGLNRIFFTAGRTDLPRRGLEVQVRAGRQLVSRILRVGIRRVGVGRKRGREQSAGSVRQRLRVEAGNVSMQDQHGEQQRKPRQHAGECGAVLTALDEPLHLLLRTPIPGRGCARGRAAARLLSPRDFVTLRRGVSSA